MLNAGNNTVEVEAIDGADSSKTNTYKLSVTGAPNQSFMHDANGNVTSNGANTYQWDAENRPIKTIRPGSGNYTEFVYDALGHKVKELEYVSSSLTSTKQNLWDGSVRVCEQRDASGNVLKLCYSLGEKVGGVTKLHGLDHLGSVRDVVGPGETIEAQYSYSPFGQQVVLQGSASASTFGYAGMYVHAPTGLNLTPYRAYDSNIGRWLSRDPIGESAGINLYTYVGNNPYLFADPLGLAKQIGTFANGQGIIYQNDDGSIFTEGAAPDSLAEVFVAGALARAATAAIGSGRAAIPTMGCSGRNLLGQSFGKLGIVVQKPELTISGFISHGLHQIINRGVSPSMILNTIKNPSIVFQQSSGRFLYVSNEAAVVLTPTGQIVTAYTSRNYDSTIKGVMSLIGH